MGESVRSLPCRDDFDSSQDLCILHKSALDILYALPIDKSLGMNDTCANFRIGCSDDSLRIFC